MENKTLTHHGILGMKWGVRRFQNKDGSLTPAGRKRQREESYHEDSKKAHSKVSARSLSDSELRSRINRLNMEKQYSDLTKVDVNKGKRAVDTIIKAGTTVATLTTTALTLYNNSSKIKKIIEGMIKK